MKGNNSFTPYQGFQCGYGQAKAMLRYMVRGGRIIIMNNTWNPALSDGNVIFAEAKQYNMWEAQTFAIGACYTG
jgi:hypothetical protein